MLYFFLTRCTFLKVVIEPQPRKIANPCLLACLQATGLGVAVGLLGIEFLGFLSGLSMFAPSVVLLSIAAHSSGKSNLDIIGLNLNATSGPEIITSHGLREKG